MPISYRSNVQRVVDARQPVSLPPEPRKELTAADFITSKNTPPRINLVWTTEHIAELRRLSRLPLTAEQIGAKMGRTESAVRCRASLEGISLHYATHRGVSTNQWSAEDSALLQQMAESGASRAAMRNAFPNRTDGAIGARMWQMGLRRKG